MRIVSCVWIHETFDVLGIQDLANLSLTNGAQSVATDLCAKRVSSQREFLKRTSGIEGENPL